ncbi:S24 family peptidase [Clostridium sp. Marseille-Q2269]|uniref:LexA family protein n=1 Tax=Clostridium sp. Marseille-Q2269 TaxID=2942205 RepID=UPI002073C19B|nr:S24 family peptidase [Clostridium sp. Marseille-Q2269]
MNLESGQNRVVKSKHLGYGLLRGKVGTGKTIAAIYRGIYLKNQYCMYEKDKVLILSKTDKNLKYIKDIYNEAENEGVQYITLFSYIEDKLYFSDIDKIINQYFSKYIKHKDIKCKLATEKQRLAIIKECISYIKDKYKNLKYVYTKYNKFFLEEVQWIKNCMYYDFEEYKNADRVGRKVKKGEGPQRVVKNSLTREAIFKIMLLYNEKLKNNNLVDYSDVVNIALKQAISHKQNRFNHIIVDEAQNFTKLELKFIECLGKKDIYSSILFVADKEEISDSKGWITKGRKLSNLNLGFEFKRFNLNKRICFGDEMLNKNAEENLSYHIKEDKLIRKDLNGNIDVYNIKCANFEDKSLDKNNNDKSENKSHKDKVKYAMDKYKYIDMKHRRSYEFIKDSSNSEEIIVEDGSVKEEYKEDNLMKIPVFNDIAAGEPILMNPCIEGDFAIPKFWVKGMKECFILKVKGDSMIGANIDDGDHVVIKQQQMAENKDIVAVNMGGSATLKRLLIKKSGAVLMPENKNYKPIEITEEGASIIGVAVGVIKEK